MKLDGRFKRMEIGRRIFPSVRRQYRLDMMVGPIGYWSELQQYQFGALKRLGLKPGHRLLDVGCGPLQGGLAYIAYLDEGNYAGIDVSAEAIAEGKRQVEESGLASKKPFLAVSDTFGEKELAGRHFDYIWCSQMLYHLDETLIEKYFKQAAKMLAPKGKFYGDIIGYPNNITENSSWSGFRFNLHSVESLRKIARRFKLTVRDLGQIVQYGYPASISLHTNILLEFTKE